MSKTQNPMLQIQIEKLTLNVGAGRDTRKLEKGEKLLKKITGIEPVRTKTDKRIQGWGLRPGLPVGCKITLRGEKAKEVLKNILHAMDHELKESSFDEYGNISFGITEYVDIKDVKYDTEIGMMGLQASVTLERPGYRVSKRKTKKSKLPRNHRINKNEAVKFMEDNYDVKVK